MRTLTRLSPNLRRLSTPRAALTPRMAYRRSGKLISDIPGVRGWISPGDPAYRSSNVDQAACSFTDKMTNTVLANIGGAKILLNGFGAGFTPPVASMLDSAEADAWGAAQPSQWPTGGEEGWLFALVQASDGGHFRSCVIGYGTTADGEGRWIGFSGHDGAFGSPMCGLSLYAAAAQSLTLGVDYTSQPVLLAARFSNAPGATELWTNGSKAVSTTSSFFSAPGSVRVGQFVNNDGGVIGQYGDLVVTGALVDQNRQLLEASILWPYGMAYLLPNDHPWRLIDPRLRR